MLDKLSEAKKKAKIVWEKTEPERRGVKESAKELYRSLKKSIETPCCQGHRYNPEDRILYIPFKEEEIVGTESITDDILLALNEKQEVIGVHIENVAPEEVHDFLESLELIEDLKKK